MIEVPQRRANMTIFSGVTDPYSHRVRLVLEEKGITYDLVAVTGNQRLTEELAIYNPYCSVPTLIDRDLALYSSEIIMEYVDERFPHPPLLPVYPVARGRSRLIIYRINRDWYSIMDQILRLNETGGQNAELRRLRHDLIDQLLNVATLFSQMPYFMSEEFSLVDCCILPLLWRLPVLGVELPNQAKPIELYAERMFARPGFIASLTKEEREMRKIL